MTYSSVEHFESNSVLYFSITHSSALSIAIWYVHVHCDAGDTRWVTQSIDIVLHTCTCQEMLVSLEMFAYCFQGLPVLNASFKRLVC